MWNERLKQLIDERCGSVPKLSYRIHYTCSGLYRLCEGIDDIRNMRVSKAFPLARELGFFTIEDMYIELGIDLKNTSL